MRDKKPSLSLSDILLRLVERVRRIESEAGQVASVLDKMIERIAVKNAAAPNPDK